MRFGVFVAADHVNFRIPRGEIFGFLGSNGCGKSTHYENALTGLLPASEGRLAIYQPVDPNDIDTVAGSAYMSQVFRSITNSPCGRICEPLPAHHIPPAGDPARVVRR